MAQKVIIKATNIAPYGKGWQINAFVEGVESEGTFYGVGKKYAIEQAERIIKQQGKLNCEPYKAEGAIFSEAQRQKVLAQFEKVSA
jgi:hypothetical protein